MSNPQAEMGHRRVRTDITDTKDSTALGRLASYPEEQVRSAYHCGSHDGRKDVLGSAYPKVFQRSNAAH